MKKFFALLMTLNRKMTFMKKGKKIIPTFVVALIAAGSCLAQTASIPGWYQEVTTISSSFSGKNQEVVNLEIGNDMGANLLVNNIQADPVHIKSNQKIGSIAVYDYGYHHDGIKKINGKRVIRFYYSLDKGSVDSEILKVNGGEWGLSQYFWFGQTSEAYQFTPQKAGTTILRYQRENSIIEVPIVVDEDPVEKDSSAGGDAPVEQN